MIEKIHDKEKGITCKKNMTISYPKKKDFVWLSYLVELVLVMVVSGASVLCFTNGCEIQIDQNIYLLAVIILSILFYISFYQRKWGGILLFAEIVAYGAAGYYYRNEISNGLAIVINTVFREIESYFGIDLAEYQVNGVDDIQAATIFYIYISVFTIGFITYIIRNDLPVIVLLLATIWISFIPEIVGLVPAIGYRLSYFAGLFVYGGSNLYKRKGTEKKLSIQKKIQGKVRLFQIISVGICFGIFTLVLGEEAYKELTKDKSFKVALQENIRRGLDNLIRGTFCQGRVSGGINFGTLGDVEGIEYTKDVKLKLRLEKKELDPIYLRGYIGSYYQNNTWVGLTKEDEEEKQRLEAISDIKVEDYDAALLYYYLAMLKYHNYTGETYQNDKEEKDKFSAYQGKEKSELIRALFPDFLGRVEIDNIAESYGTLFTPYYVSGNVLEKNGKLSVEGQRNQSYYEWDVVEDGKDVADFISDKEIYELNNWMSESFLANMETMIEDVEERLGERLEEYSTENMEEVTVGEFFKILDEYEYMEIEQEVDESWMWQLGNYVDADAKTMLELLKNFKIFRNYQQQYESYVEQTYLQVPEELKDQLLSTLTEAKNEWGFDNDLQEEWLEGLSIIENNSETIEWKKMISALLLVKQYLSENTSYTLTPGAVPKGEDFVTHFLYQNKKGFCTHYATTAALMLRSLGIPARYVEGYMAGSMNLKLGKYEKDYLSVELTDENAHAWVEIYIHDYGWVPVEMTPGYSEGFELKDIIKEEKITEPNATETPKTSQTTSSPSETSPAKITLPIIKKIKTILQSIAFIFLVIFGIWLRRFILCRYRKQKVGQKDFNECIIFIYKEIDRILCIKKHKSKEESLRDWIQKKKEEMVEGISERQWEQLLEISNRCAFSNKPPLLDDVEKSREIYHILQINSYKSSTKTKKLFYRYIKVM
ncbi:MAG: transglutaminase domain-containing protein [Lachnospiraceae bacterium]|nr:transglutaminase domain-containing protein [Lachnospiraceae bacterium]